MTDEQAYEPLHPEQLTWAVLLGRWVEFARSAVGLPEDAAGQRLRDSVPDIIMLHAVWFALEHLDELDEAEQALGIDRAAVLIERHAHALRQRWANDVLPVQIAEVIDAAENALATARQR